MRRCKLFVLATLALIASFLPGCVTSGYRSVEERYPNGEIKSKMRQANVNAVNGEAAMQSVQQLADAAGNVASGVLGVDLNSLIGLVLGGGAVGAGMRASSRSRERVRQDYESYLAGRDAAIAAQMKAQA